MITIGYATPRTAAKSFPCVLFSRFACALAAFVLASFVSALHCDAVKSLHSPDDQSESHAHDAALPACTGMSGCSQARADPIQLLAL